MQSEFSDDDKEMYLAVLQEAPNLPFNSFVSKGDIPDKVDIPNPRRYIDKAVERIIRQVSTDRSTRLIPVLGSSGTGKTHAYHSFKQKEKENRQKITEENIAEAIDWEIIYIPSPPSSVRVLLHVYTCIFESIGKKLFDIISEKLVIEKLSGVKKGIFQKPKVEEVIQKGISEYPGVFADCVKVLVVYQLDKQRRELALSWLLSNKLDSEEMNILGVNSVIEEEDICLAMIKIITENFGKVLILYFDELESPYRMHGEAAERKFLELLKRLYNEVKDLVIITAVLKEIWPRILDIADPPLRSRMEPEQEIKPFNLNDLKNYFTKSMEVFWNENNLNPPLYPLFPLNEYLIELIFEKTGGNPRNSIKLCRRFIDKVVMDEMTIEELIETGVELVAIATPAPVANEASKDFSKPREVIDDILAEEEYTIDVNPYSIAGAVLKTISNISEKKEKQIKYQFEFKFMLGNRTQTLAALIEYEGEKWGLEVPSIKTFNRDAGVAGYYAAKRLEDAINEKAIDAALLIVPEGSTGAKYEMVLQNTPEIHKFELNEETGEQLIANALEYPSQEGWDIAKIIFPDIGDYIPPISKLRDKKENELISKLQNCDSFIQNKEYEKSVRDLEIILIDAKEFNLNQIFKEAEEKINLCKNEIHMQQKFKEQEQIKNILNYAFENQKSIDTKNLIEELHFSFDDAEKYANLIHKPIEYDESEITELKLKAEEAIRKKKYRTLYDLVNTLAYDIETAKKVGKYLIDKQIIFEFPKFPKTTVPHIEIQEPERTEKKKLLIFISYAMKDSEIFKIREIAETLTNFIEIKDVLYCEEDTRNDFIQYMNKYVGKCDILLLFCSPNALKSAFVNKEWSAADAMNKQIIPVFTHSDYIPPLLRSRLGVQFDSFNLKKTIDGIYKIILKNIN